MKGHKALRRAKYVVALACLLGAGLLASSALGMTFLDDDSPPPESSSTATDTTPAPADPATSTDTATTSTESTTTTESAPPPAEPSSTLTPSVSSDYEDYNPGATVTLSGSGWGSGESIHIFVNDDVGQLWSLNGDVAAALDGRFTYAFQLPSFFVANYTVTATGSSGTVARTTFTDSNPSAIAVIPTPPAAVTVAAGGTGAFQISLTVGGNTTPCTTTYSASGLPSGTTATFSPNPVTSTGSGSSPVTSNLSVATTAGTATGNFTFNVAGANGGTCQGPGPTAGSGLLVVKAVGSVSVGAQSGPLTAGTAGSTTYSVTVTRGGATGGAFDAALSTSALPAGASGTFSPSTVSFAAGDTSKTSTLTVTTTAAAVAGTSAFTVKAENTASSSDFATGSGSLAVNPGCTAPAITTQPVDVSITYGANASFTSAASGTSPTVQWQVSTNNGASFTDVPSATSTTLSLTKPPASLSGNKYRAVFSNSCGSTTSSAATLTIAKKNLTINGAAANNKIYAGPTTPR